MTSVIKRKAIRALCLVFAIFLCATAVIYTPTDTVYAASDAEEQALKDKQAALAKQEKELQAKINKLANEAAATLERKEYLDNLVAVVNSKIQNSEALVAQLEKQVEETEKEIGEHTAKIAETQEKIKERMRANHEDGNVSYFDVILGSMSVTDFLSRMERVNTILEHDKQTLAEYETTKKELEEKKASLEESKKLQESTLATLEEDKKKNEKLAEQSASYFNAITADKEATEAMKQKVAAAESALQAELEALILERQKQNQQNPPTVKNDGKYIWPLPPGGYISCAYGDYAWNSTNRHYAVDCAIAGGTPIYASGSGVVIVATRHWSYGNYITIDHGDGISTLYAHCSRLAVSVGQTVEKGQVIGYVGSTGNSSGNHLHLEFYRNGKKINPGEYVSHGG